MSTGFAISLTIAISAAIGAMIGSAWASATALFWHARAKQLLRRLQAYRSEERVRDLPPLDFTACRRARAERPLETAAPD